MGGEWADAAQQPAEADGAREVGGGVAAAHARRSLAGALGGASEILDE